MAKMKKPVEKRVILPFPVDNTVSANKPATINISPIKKADLGHWQITHDDPPRMVWVKDD
jgi:hypothetical protein